MTLPVRGLPKDPEDQATKNPSPIATQRGLPPLPHPRGGGQTSRLLPAST